MISFTPTGLDRFLSRDNGQPVVMFNLLRDTRASPPYVTRVATT
jgi:hypothetical protein